jgi:hypothetical protein
MFTRIVLASIFSIIILSVNAQNKDYFLYKVKKGETFRSIATDYSLSPAFLADYNNLEYYNGELTAKTLRIPKEALPKEEVSVKDTGKNKVRRVADTTNEAIIIPQVTDTSTTGVTYSAPVDTSTSNTLSENKKTPRKTKNKLPVILFLSSSLILLIGAIVYYRYVNRK